MMDLTNKPILVTGGSGFLGSHLIAGLKKRGVPAENIFAPSSKEFDLRKWEDCQRVVTGQEIVFDLAAAAGDLLLRGALPGSIFYDNLIMGAQLIEAARRAGVQKIVTIGSAVAYPEHAPTPLNEKDLWMGPQSAVNIPYGFSKKILLVQGQLYRRQYGLSVIHLMPTNIYGPGERVSSGYLMPSLTRRFVDAAREDLTSVEVWGTGEPVRDFIYVDDAIEGILLAAERYDQPDPVNLGTGVGVSIKALTAMICEAVGFRGQILWDTSKPSGQLRRILDVGLAEVAFGFRAKTALKEGLMKTIRWHQGQTQTQPP